jgi:hypothetical protein
MVHRIVFILLFWGVSVQAQTFFDAVIYQHDGTHVDCMARLPVLYEKTVRFKTDHNSKTQKMQSKDIKTVCYFHRGEKIVEIEYLRYISFLEMNNTMQNVSAAEWIEVLVRGPMMLYVIQEASRSGQRKTITYHYFVKRENEEFATEIAYVRSKNGFLIYRMESGDYFANAPDIEKKIESREEGYTAKDIMNIVKEYNISQEIVD